MIGTDNMQITQEPWGLIAGRTIATPQGDFSIVKTDNWKGKPTDLDNIARLCASAPDLLDSVDSCLEIMIRAIGERLPINRGTECEETDWQTAIRKARAAISKAKGDA